MNWQEVEQKMTYLKESKFQLNILLFCDYYSVF